MATAFFRQVVRRSPMIVLLRLQGRSRGCNRILLLRELVGEFLVKFVQLHIINQKQHTDSATNCCNINESLLYFAFKTLWPLEPRHTTLPTWRKKCSNSPQLH